MGPWIRTLTLGLAAATVSRVLLAMVDTDDPAVRFFGYRLGVPLRIDGLHAVRDATLERQRLQVYQGDQWVDGIPVRASFLLLNGRVASVDLEVRPEDAERMRHCLERRLGRSHAVTSAHGHPYRSWTFGDMSVGFGYSPADRRFAATANLGDMRHFRPSAPDLP